MSRIAQLVSEIKDAGPQPTQTNALRIFRILDSNATLFKDAMEAVNFTPILAMFARLGDSNIRDFNNGYFKEDYTRAYELLMFYLNRI